MAESALPAREEPTARLWLGLGSLLFAGAILITVGVFQFFEGLAAIVTNAFYVVSPNYAYRLDVGVWGWIHILLGALLVAVGAFLLIGKLWARIVAIALAVISALANFLFIPYYPIWSILIIALNVMVIWAVVAYGQALEKWAA